jgi:hypothetical protein
MQAQEEGCTLVLVFVGVLADWKMVIIKRPPAF